jgi:uncharacterized OB-fold protein
MTEPERTRFEPPASSLAAPYWEGTRTGELRLPYCLDCGRPHWYPRRRCPHCRRARFEWRASRGTGIVASVSVQHRAGWMGLADRLPYAVGLVDLDEGVRLLAGIEGIDPDDPQAAVGTAVAVTWEDLSDGRKLALFTIQPAASTRP